MSLLTNLLAYWKLDESSGDAVDAGGGGITLTNTNVTYSAGLIGNGADFNSATDHLSSTTTAFDFDKAAAFSISCWVDFVALSSNQFIFSCQGNGAPDYNGWALYHGSSGTVNFDMYRTVSPNSAIGVRTGTGAISTTRAHIVMTKDASAASSSVTIYVNGVAQSMVIGVDNLTGTISYTGVDPRMGNRGTSFNLNAQVDEFGIWDRQLTGAEVTALYNAGAGLPFSGFAGGNPGTFFALL
jgi:hypothetical protein